MVQVLRDLELIKLVLRYLKLLIDGNDGCLEMFDLHFFLRKTSQEVFVHKDEIPGAALI